MGIEEEAQAGSEIIHLEPAAKAPLHVLHPVIKGEGQLLQRRRTGLAYVISTDGDRVKARGEERSELQGIDHQPHGRRGRKDVLLLRDVFLENVVLQRARNLFPIAALFFDGHQVHGPEHIGGRVDGHGDAGLFQIDAGEEGLHVFQRIDGHPALTHLAFALRGVGVITHQGRQVEGNGESSTAICQQVAVAGVGLLGGSKTGELAHGPEFAAVPGTVNPAGIGGLAGKTKVGGLPILRQVGLGIEPANRNAGDASKARLAMFVAVAAPGGADGLLRMGPECGGEGGFGPILFRRRRMTIAEEIGRDCVIGFRRHSSTSPTATHQHTSVRHNAERDAGAPR